MPSAWVRLPKAVLRLLDTEPSLLLYMMSSFVLLPVLHQLVLDKYCRLHLGPYCLDVQDGRGHADVTRDANHWSLLSSLCLTIPSLVMCPLIGIYSDRISRKVALLIPYGGLLLADVNYLVQSVFIRLHPSWMLLSDVLFGIAGGYAAVISTTMSYSADRIADPTQRSHKMAMLEGSIGFGGTVGFALSGVLVERFGYPWVFLFITVLHFLCVVYIVLLVDEVEHSGDKELSKTSPSIGWPVVSQLSELVVTLAAPRPNHRRRNILLILLAFFTSFLVFSGSQAIMYYYFFTKLHWKTSTYGYFRGVYYASTTVMILIAFPLLKQHSRLSDAHLALIGVLSRGIGSLMLAFTFSTWFTFIVPVFYMFNRFAAAGMRSMISKLVQSDEQGKIFASIGILEGICGLAASAIFNTVFPATRASFPGASFLIMACLMVVPAVIVGFISCTDSPSPAVAEPSDESTAADAEAIA